MSAMATWQAERLSSMIILPRCPASLIREFCSISKAMWAQNTPSALHMELCLGALLRLRLCAMIAVTWEMGEKPLRSTAILFCGLLFAAPAGAATCGGDFNGFLAAMSREAAGAGISRMVIDSAFAGLT